MMKFFITVGCILSFNAYSFVLLSPAYELSSPEKTKVKISSEGCTANGISDAALKSAIEWGIEFWNDVPESRLKLEFGGTSTASLGDSRIPKDEIIVGCGALPELSILGATEHDRANGSARVTMNQDVFTGSYSTKLFTGTLTHEMGHGVGLFHSDDPASVMTYADNGWGERPSYISQDDIDGVVYLYPNEKVAGGLLGSCSSFASDSKNMNHFFFEFLISFIAVIGVSFVLRKILSKI